MPSPVEWRQAVSVSTAGAVCDRGVCPAPGIRQALIHGQDFYFCAHHATELTQLLAAPPPSGERGESGPATTVPVVAAAESAAETQPQREVRWTSPGSSCC
jgi:hypothetical protein